MSQQRRGQAEAVSTPTDLCVIYSVLILLPQFCRNFAFVVTPDPPGAITSFIFLDGDQVDQSETTFSCSFRASNSKRLCPVEVRLSA